MPFLGVTASYALLPYWPICFPICRGDIPSFLQKQESSNLSRVPAPGFVCVPRQNERALLD